MSDLSTPGCLQSDLGHLSTPVDQDSRCGKMISSSHRHRIDIKPRDKACFLEGLERRGENQSRWCTGEIITVKEGEFTRQDSQASGKGRQRPLCRNGGQYQRCSCKELRFEVVTAFKMYLRNGHERKGSGILGRGDLPSDGETLCLSQALCDHDN